MAYPAPLDLDLANVALARLSEGTISAFTENSHQARAVAMLYPRVRALMFAALDWKFATSRAPLTSGAAGVFPWAYEYAMPTNVARCRMVLATVGSDGVALDPVPFEEGMNAAGTARVVRTDVSPGTLVYTQEVIDPTLWDGGFTSAFTVQLAAELALPITGNGQLAVALREQAGQAIQAQMPMGQTQSVTRMQRGPSTTTLARTA